MKVITEFIQHMQYLLSLNKLSNDTVTQLKHCFKDLNRINCFPTTVQQLVDSSSLEITHFTFMKENRVVFDVLLLLRKIHLHNLHD